MVKSQLIDFTSYFMVCQTKNCASLVSTKPKSISDWKKPQKVVISLQNSYFGHQNNLSPYISLRVAMFATWRSQKSLLNARIWLLVTRSLGNEHWSSASCHFILVSHLARKDCRKVAIRTPNQSFYACYKLKL